MWGWGSEIQLHVDIVIEKSEEGKRCARLIRVPASLEQIFNGGSVSFSAHRRGKTVNGWAPAENHTYITTLWLQWLPEIPDEPTRRKVTNSLKQYLKKLMTVDENVREAILGQLNGTGWYFGQDFLK